MGDIAIRVDGLGKQYRIGGPTEKYKTFRDTLSGMAGAPVRAVQRIRQGSANHSHQKTTIWALRDVSFDVRHGEVLGIIGHNGAGKSTLLKILSRITEPTEGRAVVYGRLGALLEVGTGFHPELTGRENIYLNGAILGMTRQEIERKLDEIIAFAEIEQFIDTPVKQYSSGMALRLGFSVAAHIEPDILVVDEVLAVGDLAFQRKCMGKMSEVSEQGRTVLFVSHNMAAITNLTQRSLVLSRGNVAFDGATTDAIAYYMQASETEALIHWQKHLQLPYGITLQSIRLMNRSGNETSVVQVGEDVVLQIDYQVETPVSIRFVVAFINMHGIRAFTVSNNHVNGEDFQLRTSGTIQCEIDNLQLVTGRYLIYFAMYLGKSKIYENGQTGLVDVVGGNVFGTTFVPQPGHGIYVQPSRWENIETATIRS